MDYCFIVPPTPFKGKMKGPEYERLHSATVNITYQPYAFYAGDSYFFRKPRTMHHENTTFAINICILILPCGDMYRDHHKINPNNAPIRRGNRKFKITMHTFALFDPLKMGNLMIPVESETKDSNSPQSVATPISTTWTDSTFAAGHAFVEGKNHMLCCHATAHTLMCSKISGFPIVFVPIPFKNRNDHCGQSQNLYPIEICGRFEVNWRNHIWIIMFCAIKKMWNLR